MVETPGYCRFARLQRLRPWIFGDVYPSARELRTGRIAIGVFVDRPSTSKSYASEVFEGLTRRH